MRLSTVKTYAKLAFEAGVLDEKAYTLIKGVIGYSHKEAKRVDFDAGVLTFYRPKIDDIARHELSAHAVKTACAYFENGDAPTAGPVLRGSGKGGALTHVGMNRFSIARRVKALARKVGIDELSPHDCRYFAATKYAQKPGTTTRDLMDFFGWSSPAMAARYQHASEVSDLAVR